MFQKKLQEIVTTIAEQNQLFTGKGFIKDAKVTGGFEGITSSYENYFYAYIKSEEDEDKYKTSKVEDTCGQVNINFDFKLVFDMNVCVDDFLTIIHIQLHGINNVEVVGMSDESETIYNIETGDLMKNDGYDYYSFTCRYRGVEFLDFDCVENKTITIGICKPINV